MGSVPLAEGLTDRTVGLESASMATIDERYAGVTFTQAYDRWQDVARHVLILSPHEPDYTDDEFGAAIQDTHAMLRKLAAHVIATARVRDELTLSGQILIGAMDQRDFIDSKKMGLRRFEICADGHRTFLLSRIEHAQHLPRMDDDFFALMLSLREVGVWKYDSLNPDRLIKSGVFHLVADAQAEDLSDFGALVVHWPYQMPASELSSLVPQAFAIVHQLQYRLYRAEYLSRGGKKRT